MKIEKISIEHPNKQEVKVVMISSTPPPAIDYQRLTSMIYYLIHPTKDMQTSVNSFRNILRDLKSQEPLLWKDKIVDILKSIDCYDSDIYTLLISGGFPYTNISALSPPTDISSSIPYYFSNIDHPEIPKSLQIFFASHNTPIEFASLLNTDPEKLFQYSVLLYKYSAESLISTFISSVSRVLKNQTIEEIVKFINTNSELLRVIPSGKLLHIVYSHLSVLISGSKGAYLLAEYFHNSLLAGKLPNSRLELYMLCEQKDVFESFHSKLCVERLLLDTEISRETELCNEIKEFAGPDSMEMTAALLREGQEYRIVYDKMQVVVMTSRLVRILKLNSTTTQEYIPKELPLVFENMLQEYNKGFREAYEKKVVKIHFLSSFVELQHGACRITCSFVQALVLLLFNLKECVSINEIM